MRIFKQGDLLYCARYGTRIFQVKILHDIKTDNPKQQITCEIMKGKTIIPYAENLYNSVEDLIKVIREEVQYYK